MLTQASLYVESNTEEGVWGGRGSKGGGSKSALAFPAEQHVCNVPLSDGNASDTVAIWLASHCYAWRWKES